MKNDEELRQTVIDELESEPSIKASAIGVAVENGVVTLSGQVETFAEKDVAERAVQRVTGVRAIAEEIKVVIPSVYRRTDADIGQAASNALLWDVTVPHERLKVKVEEGVVTLSGSVDYGFQKAAATNAVRNLTGVKSVRNVVEVSQRAEPTTVKKEIARVLHRNVERDAESVEVETHDGVVTLHGKVRTWIEKEDAGKAALNVPGVSKVENFISVGA